MFDLDTPVDEVLARHPELASQFVRHRMICVGCGMASFDTLDEAMQNYGLRLDDFLEELRGVVKSLPKE